MSFGNENDRGRVCATIIDKRQNSTKTIDRRRAHTRRLTGVARSAAGHVVVVHPVETFDDTNRGLLWLVNLKQPA